MPPAPPDSPVGRASGPVGGARRTRTPRVPQTGSLPLPPLSPPQSGGGSGGGGGRSRGAVGSTRAHRSGALEALLVDLGSQIHLGTSDLSQEASGAPRFHPTGLAALDARLGGGFPCGRLSEICGSSIRNPSTQSSSHSSGRTSLALGLVAETLAQGVLVAWIDLADALAPNSAAEAILARGGELEDLDRLLWVRARSADEAIRSCERLLQTEGFELVVFDFFISEFVPGQTPLRSQAPHRTPASLRIQDVTWLRLARLASATRTALVVLSNESVTGSRSELVLEMQAQSAHFAEPPSLLEAIETSAVLRRHRSRPIGEEIRLYIEEQDLHEESGDREPRQTKTNRSATKELSHDMLHTHRSEPG